jgi:predicted anti-sigma-YlaC factor YlaD
MTLHGWSVAGKSWVALGGSLLTFIVPWVVQVSVALPPPWPAVIGGVVAVLTALGVYRAPYAPAPPKQSPSAQSATAWPVS